MGRRAGEVHRTRRRAIAALVGTLLAAAACSSGSSGGRPSGANPIPANEAHGPGSPLRDGLVVPRGATLAGPVLPGNYLASLPLPPISAPVPGASASWTALIVVDGAPDTVLDDFVAQARHVGYSGGIQSCESVQGHAFCRGDLHRGPDRPAGVSAANSVPLPGGAVYFELSYGGAAASPAALLTVRFAYSRANDACDAPSACKQAVSFASPDRPRFKALPTVGAPLDTAWFGAGVQVLLGSAFVVHASENPITGRQVYVVRLDGDAGALTVAYLRKLQDAPRSNGLTAKGSRDLGVWQIQSYVVGARHAGDPTTNIDVATGRGTTYMVIVAVPAS